MAYLVYADTPRLKANSSSLACVIHYLLMDKADSSSSSANTFTSSARLRFKPFIGSVFKGTTDPKVIFGRLGVEIQDDFPP